MSTTNAPAGRDHQPRLLPQDRVPSASAAEVALFDRLTHELPSCLGELFSWRVARTPDLEAFRAQRPDGSWTTLTWRDTAETVDEIAAGLLALGVGSQQRVAIASATRVEWIQADLAIMRAGAATTTVYPSTPSADVQFILADSGSVVVFAEDAGQLAKVCTHWGSLPQLAAVVVLDPTALGPDSEHAGDQRVLSLQRLRERGRRLLESRPSAVDDASAAVQPTHLATLMYTSGTTGRPKGVRLTHSAWLYEAAASSSVDLLTPQDVQYLWLPMSHVFGKVLLSTQLTVGFASAVCGDLDRLVDNLAAVRPTFMAGAPRIFEKVHARVRTQLAAEAPARARIAAWALDVGRRASRVRQAGGEPSGPLALQLALADRLVLAKIRARFGGRVRYFVSGSAALSPEIAEWFHAVGILILEGYGLTETSAASFLNRPDRFAFGTVGEPFPGTQVRLGADGEIELRGPGLMTGYHHQSADDAQGDGAAALTDDGWFSTGDIGEFVDGRLRITDRKKDLIKTSGGKYVAPQALEIRFKAVCPYASQIVVHGDGRRFVSALITLDADAMATWAQRNGMAGQRYESVVASPQVREMVRGYVDELNAGLGSWETVKRFEILSRDLTIEDGDLTPSLKLRRRDVERRFADVLDRLYAD